MVEQGVRWLGSEHRVEVDVEKPDIWLNSRFPFYIGGVHAEVVMDNVVQRLERLIKEGEEFTYENFAKKGEYGHPESLSPKWFSWTGRAQMIIETTFGLESAVGKMLTKGLEERVIDYEADHFNKAKSHIVGALATAVDAVNEGLPTRGPVAVAEGDAMVSGRVFIVHGHDNELKTELEVFLKNLGLDPIVLHRQPDQGATLLEKFEKHSDVGYAFVLLTPDEVACTVDQLSKPEKERKMERRARANVIFEFGFFVGRLGRSRVCCLYKSDVTLPSDLNGLVYKKVTGSVENLGYNLIKELRAAGYAITV